ncbi:Rossmann-fold NAD(P)-binding domain-containing protein [Stutzerimonas azotifigens]|uniref:hypothetical protein n=1 Tax=Stutzerimonas azotifigens TaxID=291995 RepID=UPI0004884F87|nr:hypothetical protein [Stutzerimonas azotifigens]
MHISILGTDYKGLICAGCLTMRGHRVICVGRADLSLEAGKGRDYTEAPGLDVLMEQGIGTGLLSGTRDLYSAVRETDLTFLCDGDEEQCGTRMFGGLEAVGWLVGKALRGKDGPHVLVLHSRSRPREVLATLLPVLEWSSGRRAGRDIHVEVSTDYLSASSAVLQGAGIPPRRHRAVCGRAEGW